jgi:hypothetical protein
MNRNMVARKIKHFILLLFLFSLHQIQNKVNFKHLLDSYNINKAALLLSIMMIHIYISIGEKKDLIRNSNFSIESLGVCVKPRVKSIESMEHNYSVSCSQQKNTDKNES